MKPNSPLSMIVAVLLLVAASVSLAAPRLVNLSTRGQVLTGNDVLIGGFIIEGSTSKTVVVRARGPSLAALGVANALANPSLRLMSGGTTLHENDDWQTLPNAAALQASGFAPSDALESAVMATLNPGAYTAIMSGVGGTGIGIVEIFEVDHPEIPLINISTRGQVLTDGQVMIGGFIIQGSGPQTVVVRARGPSLAPLGIAGPLNDPVLQLFSGQTLMATNDNWSAATNSAQLQASGFAPADPREAAILVTLDPGAYTAIVRGAGGTTGVGIVEVFAVQDKSTGSFAFSAATAIGPPNDNAQVVIARTGGSYGAYDLYYSLIGSGCRRSETVGPVRFADGDSAPRTLDIPLAGNGVCSAILVTPSGMIGNQRAVEITVVPVVAGCPSPQTDVVLATLGGKGNPLLQRQRSGQVVFMELPATSPGRSSGQVTFGESAGGAYTPQPVTIEISISKCPGVIESDTGANFCNLRSTSGAYNSIVWLSKAVAGIDVRLNGFCWAGDSQQYYVNARWTYASCAFGVATCGFAIQHNDGPF